VERLTGFNPGGPRQASGFGTPPAPGKTYAAELSHLGAGKGLLRYLRELAEPVAHAGGDARLVLRQMLSRL
jgi:hypothetical protein